MEPRVLTQLQAARGFRRNRTKRPSSAKRMELYAARRTGLEVDIARVDSEVLDDFQLWPLGQFRFSNSQAFADDTVRVVQGCQ